MEYVIVLGTGHRGMFFQHEGTVTVVEGANFDWLHAEAERLWPGMKLVNIVCRRPVQV